jgi:hypothetical protein
MDTMTVRHTILIGSPELAAFVEAREGCAEADLDFPFSSFVDFRSKVGHRPTPSSVLMRIEGEPIAFAWV